jgi:hypothetical protein
VVRKGEEVYLIGGEATERKVLTNRCEKYNLKTFKSEELPPMKHKHRTPSVCFLGKIYGCSAYSKLKCLMEMNGSISDPFWRRSYLFSIRYRSMIMRFSSLEVSTTMRKADRSKFTALNTKNELLWGVTPSGMSTERNSGASVVHGCVAALSSIQASVYPQVGVISNMTEVVYLFENSAFLNSIITL